MIKCILCFLLSAVFFFSRAQQRITSVPLEISDRKTTHLVFPYPIMAGDCGSRDIRAQKLPGADNVLQVKAVRPDFPPTNVTVITNEGKIYSFDVFFSAFPRSLTMRFEKDDAPPFIQTQHANPRELAKHSAGILAMNKNYHIKRICPAGLELKLKGIYTDDDVLYYHVSFTNSSGLDYEIDALRCSVEDKKPVKRTVQQVLEMVPLFLYGDYELIQRDSTIHFVITLARKTLRRSQRLFIRIMEKNGARHLFLTVKPKHILHARPL